MFPLHLFLPASKVITVCYTKKSAAATLCLFMANLLSNGKRGTVMENVDKLRVVGEKDNPQL